MPFDPHKSMSQWEGRNLPEIFDVWLEGFAVTGQQGQAQYLGRFAGADFKEACQHAVQVLGMDEQSYDSERNTYWGCRFFDNARDARAMFG